MTTFPFRVVFQRAACHSVSSLIVAIGLLIAAGPAAANKLALVIGIDSYANLRPVAQLERAVADAEAVGDAFAKLEFKVTRLTTTRRNTGLDAILKDFEGFRKTVRPGDIVAVYYAGHGMGLGNRTYLVPADVQPDLEIEAKARRVLIDENELTEGLRQAGAENCYCGDRRLPRRYLRAGADAVGPGRARAAPIADRGRFQALFRERRPIGARTAAGDRRPLSQFGISSRLDLISAPWARRFGTRFLNSRALMAIARPRFPMTG